MNGLVLKSLILSLDVTFLAVHCQVLYLKVQGMKCLWHDLSIGLDHHGHQDDQGVGHVQQHGHGVLSSTSMGPPTPA